MDAHHSPSHQYSPINILASQTNINILVFLTWVISNTHPQHQGLITWHIEQHFLHHHLARMGRWRNLFHGWCVFILWWDCCCCEFSSRTRYVQSESCQNYAVWDLLELCSLRSASKYCSLWTTHTECYKIAPNIRVPIRTKSNSVIYST